MEDIFVKFLVTPLAFIFVTSLGLGWMLPKLWVLCERGLWRLSLGKSTVVQSLQIHAERDFYELIKQKETDDGSPRPLAVLQAMWIRLRELRTEIKNLRSVKNELLPSEFESAVDNLNGSWRQGQPRPILDQYMNAVKDAASDKTLDEKLRLRGLSSAAVVLYALGEINEGHRLGKQNWEEADRIEAKTESLLKWMAAYGYFYSTMFLGDFEDAMSLMARHWTNHYTLKDDDDKEKLKKDLTGKLILNPVLSLPRHMILAAAFREKPRFDREYFPNAAVFDNYQTIKSDDEIANEIYWVDSWYEEAMNLCVEGYDNQGISRNFSRSYTAFYFTLLLQSVEDERRAAVLREKIETAFNDIEDHSPVPSRYVKHGFFGIYELVNGRDENALDSLRRAAALSSVSGNGFADCIFACCHSIAAARISASKSVYLEPDINYPLKKAQKLARKIGGNFYHALYEVTYSAVCQARGKNGEAKRYLAKSKRGSAGKRILNIFRKSD